MICFASHTTTTLSTYVVLCLVAVLFVTVYAGDPRDTRNGRVVSDMNGYYDSQNIVVIPDETGKKVYSVVFHHSHNHEGGPGLRLYHTRSLDEGKTWSSPVPLESSVVKPSHDGYQFINQMTNRLFVLYGYNEYVQCNLSTKKHSRKSQETYEECSGNGWTYPNGSRLPRADMQLKAGYYLKYSDDAGVTWSARSLVPVRRTKIDHDNPWGGVIMGMFLCDKPSIIDSTVYAAFQKTTDAAGETADSEVFYLMSRDVLILDDPSQAHWETLPHGDVGLQAPTKHPAPERERARARAGEEGEAAGLLGEEPHVVAVDFGHGVGGDGDDTRRANSELSISNASKTTNETAGKHLQKLFSFWRTGEGYMAAATSDDGGESWSESFWMCYDGSRGSGQKMKNPRSSMTPLRLPQAAPDGQGDLFFLLFSNNAMTGAAGYEANSRLITWLVAGVGTEDGTIRWTQPEIVLYYKGANPLGSAALEDRPGWNPDWAIVDGSGYYDFIPPLLDEKETIAIDGDGHDGDGHDGDHHHDGEPGDLLTKYTKNGVRRFGVGFFQSGRHYLQPKGLQFVASTKLAVRFHSVSLSLIEALVVQLQVTSNDNNNNNNNNKSNQDPTETKPHKEETHRQQCVTPASRDQLRRKITSALRAAEFEVEKNEKELYPKVEGQQPSDGPGNGAVTFRAPVLPDLRAAGSGVTIGVWIEMTGLQRKGSWSASEEGELLSEANNERGDVGELGYNLFEFDATGEATRALDEPPTEDKIRKGWTLMLTTKTKGNGQQNNSQQQQQQRQQQEEDEDEKPGRSQPSVELSLHFTLSDGFHDPFEFRAGGECLSSLLAGGRKSSRRNNTNKTKTNTKANVSGSHFVGITLDGGASVLTAVVDGVLCDGGQRVNKGWAFIPQNIGEVGGSQVVFRAGNIHRSVASFGASVVDDGGHGVGDNVDGGKVGAIVKHFKIYSRPLLVTEMMLLSQVEPSADRPNENENGFCE